MEIRPICTECGIRVAEKHYVYYKGKRYQYYRRRCGMCRRPYRNNNYQQRQKEKVFRHYSGNYPSCARCGITDLDVLCIDHINDDGNAHRKSIGVPSGTRFYQWLINHNFPSGYQVLCFNCNMKKRLIKEDKWLTK